MSVVVSIGRVDQIGQQLILGDHEGGVVLFEEVVVFEIVERREHRPVEHIMAVKHGDGVVEIAFVERLGIDRAGELVLFVDIMIKIEIVVAV